MLSFVKNKMRLKLQGWKQKLLTYAGREVFIKSAANAIPVFLMSCFLFLKTVFMELDSMISRFWWGQKENGRKIHSKA